MKKIFCAFIAFLILGTYALAYDSDVKILTKDEIAKLSDSALLDAYIDASVEVEAEKSYHATSGYMPKEYKAFKDLLRYRTLLLEEIKKRKLEPPTIP